MDPCAHSVCMYVVCVCVCVCVCVVCGSLVGACQRCLVYYAPDKVIRAATGVARLHCLYLAGVSVCVLSDRCCSCPALLSVGPPSS